MKNCSFKNETFVNVSDESDLRSCEQKSENKQICNILEFKKTVTQYELTKIIYDSAFFAKVQLTPSSKLFLWALCTHFNPDNETMFPSQATVAKRLGMSEKSAERAVKELKEKNLVEYETKKVNHYKFSQKFFSLVKMSVQSRQNVGCDDRQNVGQTNNKKQKNNNERITNLFGNKNAGWQKINYEARFQKYEPTPSRAIPSIEETQKIIAERDAAGNSDFNPWEYSKHDALNWLNTLNEGFLSRSELAKSLILKYEFEEFYKFIGVKKS